MYVTIDTRVQVVLVSLSSAIYKKKKKIKKSTHTDEQTNTGDKLKRQELFIPHLQFKRQSHN